MKKPLYKLACLLCLLTLLLEHNDVFTCGAAKTVLLQPLSEACTA